jgi:hypothetical protein
MRIIQLAREGSPPPALRLSQAELSRKSNQVARARIRRFESDMPSQTVRLSTLLRAPRSGHYEFTFGAAAGGLVVGLRPASHLLKSA